MGLVDFQFCYRAVVFLFFFVFFACVFFSFCPCMELVACRGVASHSVAALIRTGSNTASRAFVCVCAWPRGRSFLSNV